MKIDAMRYRYGGALVGWEELWAIAKSVWWSYLTGNWQAGEQARLMEEEAAKQLGVKYGILTTSGSCAGLLALSALELPVGSEVIIPAVTFPTIFNIILQCGLVPVVVDSKIGTYNLDPKELEKAIGKKTKAIIAVHAVGNPCDMSEIMRIAKKHNLYVIEDNCDGWGSKINGKAVGSFGDISITSFHAAHIVSMGVGGGVFTNSKEIAGRIRQYRDWGRQANTIEPHKVKALPKDYNPRFVYDKIGYNFQILELQAAMGRVQLRRADKIKKARKNNFDYLYSHFKNNFRDSSGSWFEPLILPTSPENADACWFAFPITTARGDRGQLVSHLEKHGIETRSMFSGNIMKHPAYKDSEYRISGDLEEANYILENSFWITVHPRLKKKDLEYIVKVFNDYYAQVT